MVLKFILSLFYVLHLNTSLNMHTYYKHVISVYKKKPSPIRFILIV